MTSETQSADAKAVQHRRSRPATVLWVIGLVLAVILGLIAAALGVATLTPALGLLSMAATFLAPTVAPLLALAGVIVVIGGIIALRKGWRRSGASTAIVGAIAAATNIAVVALIVGAVVSAGGSVNVFTAIFGLSAIGGDAPDRREVYATASNGEDLLVSLYEPQNADVASPTVMFVHGGGWSGGDPDTVSTELRALANDGYLVVSVEYELATTENPTWDSAPAQVACAATWIQDNSASIGADLDRLIFWGESAGGNLAINTAGAAAQGTAGSSCDGAVPVPALVVTDFPAVNVTSVYENPMDVPGADTWKLATGYTGGTPDEYPERYAAVNSSTYLSSQFPPTLVMTATRDDLILPEDQYAWADAAQALGVDVEVAQIPLANHAYTQMANNSLGSQAHQSIAMQYISERLGDPLDEASR